MLCEGFAEKHKGAFTYIQFDVTVDYTVGKLTESVLRPLTQAVTEQGLFNGHLCTQRQSYLISSQNRKIYLITAYFKTLMFESL